MLMSQCLFWQTLRSASGRRVARTCMGIVDLLWIHRRRYSIFGMRRIHPSPVLADLLRSWCWG